MNSAMEAYNDLRALVTPAPRKRGRPAADSSVKEKTRLSADLLTFAREVLGRDKLTNSIHREWVNLLTGGSLRQLWLCPRGSYKTTLFTEALPLWSLARNPNIRILIYSSTQRTAASYLYAIRQHIRRCEKLSLWGDWQGGDKETVTEYTAPQRTVTHKEPSIYCAGGDVAITGGHFDLIIVDDLVHHRDRESRAERELHKRNIMDLVPVLEPDGKIVIVGTRWHPDDAYADIVSRNSKLLRPYDVHVYPAESGGIPQMPDIMDRAYLDEKRAELGVIGYAAQYLLAPMAPESQIFHLEGMTAHCYDPSDIPSGLPWYVYADPSLGKSGKSDYSAILAGFVWEGKVYLDYARIARVQPSQFATAYASAILHAINRKGQVVRAACESNGFQEVLRSRLEDALKASGLPGFTVQPIENTKNKGARIEALEAPLSAGNLRLRSDWAEAYPLLIDQLLTYPQGDHDDGPDGLEGLLRLTQGGASVSISVPFGGSESVSNGNGWTFA